MRQLRSLIPLGLVMAPSWRCPATTPLTIMFSSNKSDNSNIPFSSSVLKQLIKDKKNQLPKSSFTQRDTLTISIVNSLTSILAGFVIFSAFGYMSYLQGIPVTDLAVDGET